MSQNRAEQLEHATKYLELTEPKDESPLSPILNTALEEWQVASFKLEAAQKEQEQSQNTFATLALSLAENIARARNDREFLQTIAAIDTTQNNEYLNNTVTVYIETTGIFAKRDEITIPKDLQKSPLRPIIESAIHALADCHASLEDAKKILRESEKKHHVTAVATALLVAYDCGDMDFIRQLLDLSESEAAEASPEGTIELPSSAEEELAKAFAARRIKVHEEAAALTLLPDTSPKQTSSLTWADLGVESGSSEEQSIRNAINALRNSKPDFFSKTTETLILIEEIRSMDEIILQLILFETFKDIRSWKSLARILSLRWHPEEKTLKPMDFFEDHAKHIQNDSAKTLLPEEKIKEKPAALSATDSAAIKQDEIHEDRFPRTDGEIKNFILKCRAQLRRYASEKKFSLHFPLTPREFAKLDARLKQKYVDENSERIGHSSIRNIQYTEIEIIMLMALKDFEGRYKMNDIKLKRTLEKFREQFSSM